MPAARPIRRALDGLSPYDAEAIQRWALQRITDEVVRTATVRPRLLVLCDDHLEDLDLSTVTEGDPVQTFVELAARPGVEHRILWGHAHLPAEEGDQDVAWAFGARTDEERSFWFAVRPFRRLPGGLGSGDVPGNPLRRSPGDRPAEPVAADRRDPRRRPRLADRRWKPLGGLHVAQRGLHRRLHLLVRSTSTTPPAARRTGGSGSGRSPSRAASAP